MSDEQQTQPHSHPVDFWKRWEMATFNASATPKTPLHPGTGLESPDVHDELDKLRTATRAQARAQGYAAGHAEGLAIGRQEGQDEGRKQGYETGLSMGHAAGSEQAEIEARELQTVAASCAEAIGSIESEMGQALISLAINIAEQVLRSTLAANPEKIMDLVRDIAHVDLDQDAVLHLRVNPADLALIKDYITENTGTKKWRITGDETIARGGCIAETALGNIDATLQTRWQRVTSALGQNALHDQRPHGTDE